MFTTDVQLNGLAVLVIMIGLPTLITISLWITYECFVRIYRALKGGK